LHLIFNDKAGIEKLAAAKKNREHLHHTNIRNIYNGIIGYGYALSEIPKVQGKGVYLATLLSEILVTSFMVNFLEPAEPSIYGYGYDPRYISELVANQGNSVKTLQ
jgi:hypothetical protein